ncbi:hypothetical protein Tco_0774386 [Tanacetum coccineum]|uniref:Copia protein n=1 Tax=Tanacetum coccineum TaxID=301880 RepID=A0ABQ4ZRU9_9ASTR
MMGELKLFLGLHVHQSLRGIFISQFKYALDILKKNRIDKCDSIDTPMATQPKLDENLSGTPIDKMKYRSMIGSLMYLIASRPDLVHATCYCVHADHAGCLDTCKSTSGGIRFQCDKLVGWSSKKQDCTAMSTVEAEYVVLYTSYAHVLWMRTQLTDYGFNFNKIPMYCDSKSAIAISCNPTRYSRTKHINVRYHFIKEQNERLEYLVGRLGMRCLTPAELEVLENESA